MTKKIKPKKYWWVSRDDVKGSDGDFYGLHFLCKKPKTIGGNVYPGGSMVNFLKGKEFRQLFTLRLRKGECKEIERPQLKLKQKGEQTK